MPGKNHIEFKLIQENPKKVQRFLCSFSLYMIEAVFETRYYYRNYWSKLYSRRVIIIDRRVIVYKYENQRKKIMLLIEYYT